MENSDNTIDIDSTQCCSQGISKYGKYLKEACELYRENFLKLIVLMIVAALALVVVGELFPLVISSFFSCFLCVLVAGPVIFIIYLLLLDLISQNTHDDWLQLIKDRQANSYLQGLYLVLFWGFVFYIASASLHSLFWTSLGCLLTLAVGICLHAALLFSMLFVVDKEMNFFTASLESVDLTKAHFLGFLGFSFVLLLVLTWAPMVFYSEGGLSFFGYVFSILSAPIYFLGVTLAYRDNVSVSSVSVPDTSSVPESSPEENPS